MKVYHDHLGTGIISTAIIKIFWNILALLKFDDIFILMIIYVNNNYQILQVNQKKVPVVIGVSYKNDREYRFVCMSFVFYAKPL